MKQLLKIYIRLVLALLPIIFFPLMIDSLGVGKNWLLVVLTAIGLVVWVIGLITDRERAKVKWNSTMSWLWLLVIMAGVSFAMSEVGVRGRSGVAVFGLGTFLASGVMGFLWLQVSDEEERKKQLNWLTVSGLLVAVVSLLVFLIPTSRLPLNLPKENPIMSITTDWSLTGSLLNEMWLMVVLVWFWVEKLWRKLKARENYLLAAAVSGILTLIIFLDGYKIFKNGWGYLDLGNSWMVAVESLKQEPLLGVGVGNFLEAFTRWRPMDYNLSQTWAVLFGGSGSWLLNVWTEMGIVGLVLLLLIWWKGFKKQSQIDEKVKAMILGILLLVSPATLIGWWLWLWIVMGGKNENVKENRVMLRFGDEGGVNVGPALLLVLVVAGLGWGGYWWMRTMVGEIYLRNSVLAATKNDGIGMYNWQIKAVGINPNSAEYRRIYSQTNMTLAANLLTAQGVSDEDKEKGVVLTQQAVREAKAAVAMDQKNASYWTNLAVIYKQLIGSVEGAADWSLQAYYQAGLLDPVNPLIKFDMGSLLFALNSFEEADRMFEQTVTLKFDLANGWYNWAHSAKKLNKLNEAVARLNQALSLVEPGSADYDRALAELADWKKELESATKKQQTQTEQPETLKLPEALPTPNEEVEVPKEGLEPPVGTE